MSVSLPPRGRGTASNPHNRFAAQRIIASDDGWYQEVPPSRATEVRAETAKTIITRNQSPDLPFDRSLNPYRGCEPVASTAMRGPATLTGTCRRGWISRPA